MYTPTLSSRLAEDWNGVSKEVDRLDAWSNLYYYTPINEIYKAWHTMTLHRSAGPMPKAKKINNTKEGAKKNAPASSTDTSV